MQRPVLYLVQADLLVLLCRVRGAREECTVVGVGVIRRTVPTQAFRIGIRVAGLEKTYDVNQTGQFEVAAQRGQRSVGMDMGSVVAGIICM